MTMLANCPLPTHLNGIAATACPQKFGQIQKIAFGRTYADRFASGATFISEGSWDNLIAAINDSKLVISPYLAGLSFPVAAPITQGGNDNTTINGVTDLQGGQMIVVPFVLTNQSAQTMREFRDLAAETMLQPGFSQLEAYLFNDNDEVIYDETSAGTEYNGFRIYNLYIPDVSSNGLNSNNTYNCQFELPFGWSQYWNKQKMTWNPRDLANAAS